jgi:hypothetical protein
LVETSPVVEQPELSFMHVHSSEALFDVHAAGTVLQLLGFHAIADESSDSEQYWPLVHEAEPHVTPAGGVTVPPPSPLLPPAAGQSDVKLEALAMSSQLFVSRHVS